MFWKYHLSILCLSILVHNGVLICNIASALSQSPLSVSTNVNIDIPTSTFSTITNRQIGILDGAELKGLLDFTNKNEKDKKQRRKNDAGIVKFVTGIIKENGKERRVIGLETEDSSSLENAVLANIPKGVSDSDAISTAMASLVGVHCCIPRVTRVGGSKEDANDFVSGKAVVLGGGEYACYAAKAMDALGISVTLVSTGNPRIDNSKVSIMKPSVGELELSFCDVVGEFDSLLDTLYDEGQGSFVKSGVVEQLELKHNCTRYISTCTRGQEIIRESGVFFGPNEVKSYEKDIIASVKSSSKIQQVPIPSNFGSMTLQKLLDEKILYTGKRGSEPILRGWNLKDFWEYTSWPRDSGGAMNSRFGLPMIEDADTLWDIVADEGSTSNSKEEVIMESDQKQLSIRKPKSKSNPYVVEIDNIAELQEKVISAEMDCVLFFSAPFCRTCKLLSPTYTRMARQAKDDDASLSYVKVSAYGDSGKKLGRALGLNAVPNFILFRKGERYGTPISASKLPSKKLDLAVDYLTSGKDWDTKVFEKMKS